MSETDSAAAPESGTTIPTFEELAADPEIAALLDFEPVVRIVKRDNGWTPELQRELIARIAATGTIKAALEQMRKGHAGAADLRKVADAHGYRASLAAAMALGRRRNRLDAQPPFTGEMPGFTDRPGNRSPRTEPAPLPGQVMNELGDWEDEASLERRAAEARDSISGKLLAARRLYLQEIAGSPGKRAAFEILTELPIDWDAAERLEPQEDEPWKRPNMRKPDMLLTAENGWLGGMAHGPDKMAELRRAIDAHRASEGMEPVDWEGE
jgi:hypothetical protein